MTAVQTIIALRRRISLQRRRAVSRQTNAAEEDLGSTVQLVPVQQLSKDWCEYPYARGSPPTPAHVQVPVQL